MATIGHALLGLSIGEIGLPAARESRLRSVWFGFVVAMAYLPDLVEWVALFVRSDEADRHFVSNSLPIVCALCAAVICIMALTTRIRDLRSYLAMALAILSHWALDTMGARKILAALYGAGRSDHLAYLDTAIAELWFYGLILLITALVVAAKKPGCPPKGAKAAWVIGVAAVAAAATRYTILWVLVYAVAATHAMLLGRNRWTWRMLWNIAPIAPLMVIPVTSYQARRLTFEAIERRQEGDPAGALAIHARVIKLPTRDSVVHNYIEMSRCFEAMGDLKHAEQALLDAVRISRNTNPHVPNLWLAKFYMYRPFEGTPYYQPRKAEQILREILRESSDPDDQRWAGGVLRELLSRKDETR
ncbi:MAG: hypothetical protein KF841_04140 [Phycisphaerae bacterium]|nr:hypothetical protein [Phycisphaerae bacterium]